MEHTGYVIPKWTKLARGMRGGQPVPPFEGSWAPDGPYWHLRGNGGIMTIPADMYRWHLALLGDKVLSAASRKKLFTPYVKEGDAPSSYAYGWAIFPLPGGHQLIAHNGGNGIFAADFRRYVDDGVVIYITSNVSEKPSIAVNRFVSRIALGQDVPMPPRIVDVRSDKLRALEGTYGSFQVVAEGNGVALIPRDAAALAMMITFADAPKMTARSKEVADAIVRGDYKVLHDAFAEPRPLEQIETRQRAMRAEMESRQGALKSATVLGITRGRNGPTAIVRLDFEHGSEFLNLIWDGPNALVGLQFTQVGPRTVFQPVSATEFASYDFFSGETKTVKFHEDNLAIGDKTFSR